MLVKSLTEYIRSHFSENGLRRIEGRQKCCFGVSAKVMQKTNTTILKSLAPLFFER